MDFHPACARKVFGMSEAPRMPYTRDNMSDLARKVIRTSASVTGVQAKMSLDVDRGGKNEPARFTIVGLWGKYIFKPQSSRYRCLPELEDLTMKMAAAAGIRTATHSLIRLSDGEIGYITRRMDRDSKGKKISMLDLCQLSNRLTEHKYYGTYPQLADTIMKYSSAPMLDVQRFWEVVLFSWITGNSDMHLKNFSLLSTTRGKYGLSPAYDLLNVHLIFNDPEELALPLDGKKKKITRQNFVRAMQISGLNEKVIENIFKKFIKVVPKWNALIDESFLPDDLKERYKEIVAANVAKII